MASVRRTVVQHGPGDVSFNKGAGSRRWVPSLRDRVLRALDCLVLATSRRLASKGERDYPYSSNYYLLLPESIESIYLLWKTTKRGEMRERGWTMWQGVERETRVAHGYATVKNLRGHSVRHSDSLLSYCYFFAGTPRYYYLLYSDADPWPLDNSGGAPAAGVPSA